MDAKTREALEHLLTMAVGTLRHLPAPSGREIAARNADLDSLAVVRQFLDAPEEAPPRALWVRGGSWLAYPPTHDGPAFVKFDGSVFVECEDRASAERIAADLTAYFGRLRP